jgi:hypothetical protein
MNGEFENSASDFAYGIGPIVIGDDDTKGLVLGVNRSEYDREWIRRIKLKSDNNPQNKPKKLPFSNFITLEIVRAGGLEKLSRAITPSVYSREEVIKAAYPKWRHVRSSIKHHYFQKALRRLSEESNLELYAINLLISPKIARKVLSEGGCGFLFEELSKRFHRAISRRPMMWLKLEAIKKAPPVINQRTGRVIIKGDISKGRGVLHCHGSILLSEAESQELKKVIRKFNASYNPTFKNHELRFELINKNCNPEIDDPTWVEYCNKYNRLNKAFFNGLDRFSRSKQLGSLAKKIYEEDRKEIKSK